MSREIEIKVRVENAAPLTELLEREGEFWYESRQMDEYFVPVFRDFLAERPIREWLRIRTEDGKASINYKDWQYGPDGTSDHCEEHESGISDADALRNILTALDIRPVVTVDKVRRAYAYRDYEVALDTVEGLGAFVEIEYKGADAESVDTKSVADGMLAFLDEIGVGTVSRDISGYPFLLLEAQGLLRRDG
ncbi:MAG: class IV adenylate cyclase [Candidatus Moranbacteria bacterium]|nr:class IV adenylate cyclase [Candidatus Moranbacteria bacterium]